MCGIVGGCAQRDVAAILMEGLRRLEYRGYDSAGLAVVSADGGLFRERTAGRVADLEDALARRAPGPEGLPAGGTGIAHTRWATHGRPTESNAHPHVTRGGIAVVHNGIIENHASLRADLEARGWAFDSETDTEVVAALIQERVSEGDDLLAAVRAVLARLTGAYAFGVVHAGEPDRLIAARRGSPLVVGVGIGEHFIASDLAALLPVTRQFVFLEEGDLADIARQRLVIRDAGGDPVDRPVHTSELSAEAAERGGYRHFMLKEIHEQPTAVSQTLDGRFRDDRVAETAFGPAAEALLSRVERLQIVACGTSYHAGLVARYWLEHYAGIPCEVEVASEFRYRTHAVSPGTLLLTLSQSGETADTLAALREARHSTYIGAMTICNVPESSLVRESDLAFMTRAGPEIGVASTKAFTTQLAALLLIVAVLARYAGRPETEVALVGAAARLPAALDATLAIEDRVAAWAEHFVDRHHALFLGRGAHHPIAMEGALKLKEISYIHAEAYPAGELKHGPLALVDDDMPVVAVAPRDDLLDKLRSNLQEVRARGGELFVFADEGTAMCAGEGYHVLEIPAPLEVLSPILQTIPLQMLAYHVAVLRGTDVDKPRNLAKSVTVE